jgi:hypothetical protein
VRESVRIEAVAKLHAASFVGESDSVAANGIRRPKAGAQKSAVRKIISSVERLSLDPGYIIHSWSGLKRSFPETKMSEAH